MPKTDNGKANMKPMRRLAVAVVFVLLSGLGMSGCVEYCFGPGMCGSMPAWWVDPPGPPSRCNDWLNPVLNWHGCDKSDADLSGSDLSGADLRAADLRKADVSNARLVDADLSGADLSGANLSGANLSGANLSGTDLSGATWIDGETECKVGSIGECKR